MEYLIKPNGEGLFAEKKNGQAMIDSRTVAEVFGKEHRNVLRAIENLDCSPEFNKLNFEQVKYKAKNGQKQPCYNMTKAYAIGKGWNIGAKMIMEGDE